MNPRKAETTVREEPIGYDKEKYFAHLLDQYRLYVEMADRLTGRRVLVNNSFITLIGAGAVAYAAAPSHFEQQEGLIIFFRFGVSAFSVLLAVMWRATINYYRELATAKFKVIFEIEELLPAQPYKMEWEYLQRARREANKKHTRGQATIEMNLPLIAGFFALVGLIATALSAYHKLQPYLLWAAPG